MFLRQLNEQDKERIDNFDATMDYIIDLCAEELAFLHKTRELVRDREVPANIPFWLEVLNAIDRMEQIICELPMGAEDIFNGVCSLLKLD